jgi:hypothetical protein
MLTTIYNRAMQLGWSNVAAAAASCCAYHGPNGCTLGHRQRITNAYNNITSGNPDRAYCYGELNHGYP